MLATADLARYAGQFVWLELNYDNEANRAFLAQYKAGATPTFFVIDSQDGKVAAAQTGAMSLEELKQFLDRGSNRILAKKQSPADAALARGDALVIEKPAEAVKAYREALRLAPASWPRRDLAKASLVVALGDSEQWRDCAETARAEGSRMTRNEAFARTVVTGLWCVVRGEPQPWWQDEAQKIEPLAIEALSLKATVRDDRNELYRRLMYVSLLRKDEGAAAKWGNRWLDELDAIRPANEEERSAVDIARVENIQAFGDPKRILPALIASERALPNNWNASLRVAQMEIAAKNNPQAVAACDRALSRDPGPVGRTWILQTKAEALTNQGKTAEARRNLEEALQAANGIPNERNRENNIKRIRQVLDEQAKSKDR